MQTKRFTRLFQAVLVFLMFSVAPALLAEGETASAETAVKATTTAISEAANNPNAKYYAIAAAVAIGSMSAAYAVGKIGAAVMGAAAEKPEIMSKALPFVALGEGIALFGFLVAIFLL